MKLVLLAAPALIFLVNAPVSAGEMTVKVTHDSFTPEKLTIMSGDTVTFENQVKMPGGHVITADDGSFKSKPLATPGAKWSRTFKSAGSHSFYINEHAWVKGMVVVK